jgi:hypothetical protein
MFAQSNARFGGHSGRRHVGEALSQPEDGVSGLSLVSAINGVRNGVNLLRAPRIMWCRGGFKSAPTWAGAIG